MELRETVLHRRMVRRFDPDGAVAPEVVRDLVALAVRAPSAGFSQGWDFLALLDPADREAFWSATDDGTPPDAWRRGVSASPALVLCLSDPDAYLDRYAQPDTAAALEVVPGALGVRSAVVGAVALAIARVAAG